MISFLYKYTASSIYIPTCYRSNIPNSTITHGHHNGGINGIQLEFFSPIHTYTPFTTNRATLSHHLSTQVSLLFPLSYAVVAHSTHTSTHSLTHNLIIPFQVHIYAWARLTLQPTMCQPSWTKLKATPSKNAITNFKLHSPYRYPSSCFHILVTLRTFSEGDIIMSKYVI